MVRQRIHLDVWVDQDQFPGAMDSPQSAAKIVEQILKDRIEHYNPVVYASGRR